MTMAVMVNFNSFSIAIFIVTPNGSAGNVEKLHYNGPIFQIWQDHP